MAKGFEGWKDGIDKAVGNPAWNKHDSTIQWTVLAYNNHLRKTPGFCSLDWTMVKVMAWTETGAKSRKWNTSPMQIGNKGDEGLTELRNKKKWGMLIPPGLKSSVYGVGAYSPEGNIAAGVGYLLLRHAKTKWESVPDGSEIFEVKVKKGDNPDKIARDNGSTKDHVLLLNPGLDPAKMQPGQVVKVQKASIKHVITGWEIITTSSAADYNGAQDRRGDPTYPERLAYVSRVIGRSEAIQCER
jgi:hypothetical protein